MTHLTWIGITVLSLFLNQVTCDAPPTPAPPIYLPLDGTHALGPGPQTSATYGPPGPEFNYYWDSSLPLKSDMNVFGNQTKAAYYSITDDPKAKRGFIIMNLEKNVVLLKATDKGKAMCGFGYTYHAEDQHPTSYDIHTRGAATDRWIMTVGHDATKLTYYRGHTENQGTIKFTPNGTVAASFTLQDAKSWGGPYDRVMLSIAKTTYIEPYEFVGLWILVSKRLKRCSY